jgi:hypothetical protein
MTPVQFFDPLLQSWTIFAWGENSELHKWVVSTTGNLTYVAQSNEFASANVRGNPPGGMPGGFCSGSSNGADPNSAILVCTIPYGDANAQVVNGRLLVYDAVHLAADGSLKVLWDSERFAITFLFNKFDPPVIDGGQIIDFVDEAKALDKLESPRWWSNVRLRSFEFCDSHVPSGKSVGNKDTDSFSLLCEWEAQSGRQLVEAGR